MVAAVLVVVAATACTGHPAHSGAPVPAGTTTPSAPLPPTLPAAASSAPVPLPAQLHSPSQPTIVISEASPEQLSVAVSQTFFTSAPVAIVSALGQASITRATAAAERLGVPLLVAGDAAPAGASAGASAGSLSARPSAASSGPAPGDAVRAELRRLGCTDVLTVGNPPALPGVRVTGDAAQLPALAAAAQLHDTTVLVHAPEDAGTAAAVATAKAAGATVVETRGADPRADAFTVAALAAAPTQHVVALGADFGPADRLAARVAVAHTGAQLPGGGQLVFPGRRFVALYGHPGGAALGVLGAQDLDASIARARDLAAQYDGLSDVPVVPTFEIIATVASGSPGRDGNYSNESSVESLRPWVEKAVDAGLYVVLDIQPGRADPLDQAKSYASLLQLPNVGLAVDPEWALGAAQKPLEQIGSIDSSKLNEIGAWLDAFTASKHLPQKLLVLHQFRLSMIGNEAKLKTGYDNVAVLIHMDGQGAPANKDATWKSVVGAAPKGLPFGWKNFYKEDHPMLTPEQTMAHAPKPMMISYQ